MFKEDFGWAHENTCDQMKTCFFCSSTSNRAVAAAAEWKPRGHSEGTLEKSLKLKFFHFCSLSHSRFSFKEWNKKKRQKQMCGRERD